MKLTLVNSDVIESSPAGFTTNFYPVAAFEAEFGLLDILEKDPRMAKGVEGFLEDFKVIGDRVIVNFTVIGKGKRR